jgi:hypothetical protein
MARAKGGADHGSRPKTRANSRFKADTPSAIGIFMLRRLLFIVIVGSSFAQPVLAAKKAPPKAPSSAQTEPAAPAPPQDAPQPAATESASDRPSNKVTGTFSTLQNMGSEVEDLIGIEVTIVGTRSGLQAVVQTADGVPSAPVVVPVNVDGMRVSFPVPSATGDLMEFKGKVTPQGLTGKLDGRSLTLPRRKSYWQ